MENVITRFAPSPTGYLHLGHIYSALFTYKETQRLGGKMLVRMEDIDFDKCSEEFENSILEDLRFFDIQFEPFILHQKERFEIYKTAVANLAKLGLLYPCFCSRGDIRREIQHIQSAPHGIGDDPYYPGTCRELSEAEIEVKIKQNLPYSMRIDVKKALDIACKGHKKLEFEDLSAGKFEVDVDSIGDMIVARKFIGISYHIACVVDDAFQGVNLVTRGKDLLPYCHLQRLLQELLELPTPIYHHHSLAVDNDGKRLAKRDNDTTVRSLIKTGLSKQEILDKLILS